MNARHTIVAVVGDLMTRSNAACAIALLGALLSNGICLADDSPHVDPIFTVTYSTRAPEVRAAEAKSDGVTIWPGATVVANFAAGPTALAHLVKRSPDNRLALFIDGALASYVTADPSDKSDEVSFNLSPNDDTAAALAALSAGERHRVVLDLGFSSKLRNLTSPRTVTFDPTPGVSFKAQRAEKEETFSLGDELVATLSSGTLSELKRVARAKTGSDELGVFVSDRFLALGVATGADEVRFRLDRTDSTAEAWTQLLRVARNRRVPVVVGYGEKGPGFTRPAFLTLVRAPLDGWPLFVAVVTAGLIVIAIVILFRFPSLIKDPGPLPAQVRTFSLGKTQCYWWFVWIVAASGFSWAALGVIPKFTPTTLTLLGLGAATAVLSASVTEGKRDKALPPVQAVTLADVALMTPEQRDAFGHKEGFLRDLLTDADGYSIFRLQMLIWTVLLTVYFVEQVVNRLVLPDFDSSLLALMGISSGTYLGFKIPERQS